MSTENENKAKKPKRAVYELPTSPFMNIDQASAYLQVPKGTLRCWSSERKIPTRKLCGKLMFHRGDIDEWTLRTVRPANAFQTKFQEVQERLRSLKTEYTDTRQKHSGNGTG